MMKITPKTSTKFFEALTDTEVMGVIEKTVAQVMIDKLLKDETYWENFNV